MSARWARTARGWVVALLAGVLSAALHDSAGGGFPAPAVMLLAVLLTGIVSTALVGPAPSAPRLAVTVGAGQVTFHTVFTVLGGTGSVSIASSGHAGHVGHTVLFGDSGVTHAASHTGAGMLVAHLLAGSICALLLTHSERTLRELKRMAVFALARLTRDPVPQPLPRRNASGMDFFVALDTAARSIGTLRYRGPPTASRAA